MTVIGQKRVHLEKVDSTNSFASGLLKEGLPVEGIAVVADLQEAGRGQRGNAWFSEPGKNILTSIILYPCFLSPMQQFYLNMAVSMAVVDAITNISGERQGLKVKWPNDIYIGNKKVAGILIENTVIGTVLKSSVIGIGLNLNQEKFPDLPNAASLTNISGRAYHLDDALDALFSAIQHRYQVLKSKQFVLLHQDYLQNLFRLNTPAEFILPEGKKITAVITDVTPEGQLELRLPFGKLMRFGFREINYLI